MGSSLGCSALMFIEKIRMGRLLRGLLGRLMRWEICIVTLNGHFHFENRATALYTLYCWRTVSSSGCCRRSNAADQGSVGRLPKGFPESTGSQHVEMES